MSFLSFCTFKKTKKKSSNGLPETQKLYENRTLQTKPKNEDGKPSQLHRGSARPARRGSGRREALPGRAATAPSCPHPREHLGALHTSWRGAPLRPGQLRVSCPRLLVTRHLPPCEPVSVTGLQIHQLHFRPPIQWQSAHFYFVGGRGPIC